MMNDDLVGRCGRYPECRGDLKLPRHFVVFALFFLVSLYACTDKMPAPILPDEKTSRIMADLAIAEAAVQALNDYPKDSLMAVYFSQVFEMHGATKEIYEQNLRILSKDLPRLQKCLQQADALLKINDKTN